MSIPDLVINKIYYYACIQPKEAINKEYHKNFSWRDRTGDYPLSLNSPDHILIYKYNTPSMMVVNYRTLLTPQYCDREIRNIYKRISGPIVAQLPQRYLNLS